ncbi:MAG: hypothetical protein QXJ14_02690 [Candidatus Aenigmatarchaeota archaeon]
MIRDLIKAYFKLLISNTENKQQKLILLNELSKFLLNKNNIQDALNEYNIKYINLYINANDFKNILINYDIYKKNEIAEILKKDLIYYISDLLIQNSDAINNFLELLINLSKKIKIDIKEEISINDFINVFKAENNMYVNVFGDSGTGKTVITFFISYLMNNNNFYFTDFDDFKNFVKNIIENDDKLRIKALVFDELKNFTENEIKILNRIRYFNYNQQPITIFLITHEKNEFIKLKNQISLYAYFYKKQHMRIYKKKYIIRSKLRVLFPSLYKPLLNEYLLNNIYFNFSSNLLKKIKDEIYNYEYSAKKNIILDLLK